MDWCSFRLTFAPIMFELGFTNAKSTSIQTLDQRNQFEGLIANGKFAGVPSVTLRSHTRMQCTGNSTGNVAKPHW